MKSPGESTATPLTPELRKRFERVFLRHRHDLLKQARRCVRENTTTSADDVLGRAAWSVMRLITPEYSDGRIVMLLRKAIQTSAIDLLRSHGRLIPEEYAMPVVFAAQKYVKNRTEAHHPGVTQSAPSSAAHNSLREVETHTTLEMISATLPDGAYEILLCKYEGLSDKESAEHLGLTEDGFKSRLYRLRRRIAKDGCEVAIDPEPRGSAVWRRTFS